MVSRLFEAPELSLLAAELARREPARRRAGIRHLLSHLAVRALATRPVLREIARAVLGGDAFPFRATLFEKSPAQNWLVAWHQDTALPLAARVEAPGWGPWSKKAGLLYARAPAEALEAIVAVRVHLDESSEANGPLRVLPHTHGLGVLGERQIRARSAGAAGIACTAPVGGGVVMRPLILHASSKSASAVPRRVLHLEYARVREFRGGLVVGAA